MLLVFLKTQYIGVDLHLNFYDFEVFFKIFFESKPFVLRSTPLCVRMRFETGNWKRRRKMSLPRCKSEKRTVNDGKLQVFFSNSLVSVETENKSVISSLRCTGLIQSTLSSSLVRSFFFSLFVSVIAPVHPWDELVLELQRTQFNDEDSPSNLWELRRNCFNSNWFD
jgi:hypothetical protein